VFVETAEARRGAHAAGDTPDDDHSLRAVHDGYLTTLVRYPHGYGTEDVPRTAA
jgi:hypothetical protein